MASAQRSRATPTVEDRDYDDLVRVDAIVHTVREGWDDRPLEPECVLK